MQTDITKSTAQVEPHSDAMMEIDESDVTHVEEDTDAIENGAKGIKGN